MLVFGTAFKIKLEFFLALRNHLGGFTLVILLKLPRNATRTHTGLQVHARIKQCRIIS